MTRRDMVFQGVVALALITGIVGGNFVLHRWMLGNSTSREADAGIVTTTQGSNLSVDDEVELFDLKPVRREARAATQTDPAVRHELLKKLIAAKLPDASAEDRAAWLEKMEEISLETAAEILDLRSELRLFETERGTELPRI